MLFQSYSLWAFRYHSLNCQLNVKSPKESAVFDHIFHMDHNASSDDSETLVKESAEFRLLFRELLLILLDDPQLNRYVRLIRLERFS